MSSYKGIHTRGAALLLFVLFFLATSVSLILTIGKGVYDEYAIYQSLRIGKEAYFAAENGIEDAIYRYRNGMQYSNTESFTVEGNATAVSRTVSGDTFIFTAEGTARESVRRVQVVLVIGGGASFGFGIQSGNGGFTLANSARVYGNVFSNGTVSGSNNYVYGDIISAGASGSVTSIHATGSVWANTITGGSVGQQAYYQSISGTLVSGSACSGGNPNCYPGSPNQGTVAMPISDAQIEEWKLAAEAGGVIPLASCSGGVATGSYTIDTDQTIGPIKVPCNLIISKNNTNVTIAGPVWAVGNISTENGPVIHTDVSVPGKGGILIADNPSNRTASSKISIQGSAGFNGTTDDAYILMISMNTSSFDGGGEIAIDINNNTPNDKRDVIYYAPYGRLRGGNSLLLRGATANQIDLSNSASVYYETGLLNPLFAGTGGSYVVSTWKEIE